MLLRPACEGDLDDFSVEWVGRVYGHSLLVRPGDFMEVIGWCFASIGMSDAAKPLLYQILLSQQLCEELLHASHQCAGVWGNVG